MLFSDVVVKGHQLTPAMLVEAYEIEEEATGEVVRIELPPAAFPEELEGVLTVDVRDDYYSNGLPVSMMNPLDFETFGEEGMDTYLPAYDSINGVVDGAPFNSGFLANEGTVRETYRLALASMPHELLEHTVTPDGYHLAEIHSGEWGSFKPGKREMEWQGSASYKVDPLTGDEVPAKPKRWAVRQKLRGYEEWEELSVTF